MPPEQAPVVVESMEAAIAEDDRRAPRAPSDRERDRTNRQAFQRATGSRKAGRQSTGRGRRARRDGRDDEDYEPLRRERPRSRDRRDDREPEQGDDAWQGEFDDLMDPSGEFEDDDGGADEEYENSFDDEQDDEDRDDDRRDRRPRGRDREDWRADLPDKLLTAIRRAATLPDSALDAMTFEEVEAYAEAELARQSSTDSLLRQKSPTQDEPGSRGTRASEAGDSDGQEVAASDRPSAIDLEALVRPQLGALGVDEKDMSILIAPLKAVQEHMQTQLDAAVAQAGKAIEASNQGPATALALQLAQRAIAAEMKSKWARLKDPKVMRQVRADAGALWKERAPHAGKDFYGALERTVEDAAYRRLGPPDEGAAPKRRRGSSARSDSRTSSRPERRRRDGRPERNLSPLEKKRRIFRAVSSDDHQHGQRPDRTLKSARIA